MVQLEVCCKRGLNMAYLRLQRLDDYLDAFVRTRMSNA
jgi:hypothetical protein